jgi:hypothetical protein
MMPILPRGLINTPDGCAAALFRNQPTGRFAWPSLPALQWRVPGPHRERVNDRPVNLCRCSRLSRRHFRRQACAVNAQINNRMYDDRQNERAGDKYQNFRVESVHPVVPNFRGVVAEGGNSKICTVLLLHSF